MNLEVKEKENEVQTMRQLRMVIQLKQSGEGVHVVEKGLAKINMKYINLNKLRARALPHREMGGDRDD